MNQNMSPSRCPPLGHSKQPILTVRNSVFNQMKKIKLIKPLFFHNKWQSIVLMIITIWGCNCPSSRLLEGRLVSLTESLHSGWPSQKSVFSVPINIFWAHNKDSEEYENPTVLSFRKIFAEVLTENKILEKGKAVDDDIKRAPKHKWKSNQSMIISFSLYHHLQKYFNSRSWVCKAVRKYQQYVGRTKGCKTYIRTNCVCNPVGLICRLLHTAC